MLDTFRIRHLTYAGYEADDIIATLTTQALAEGMEVLILTGDRDSLQLVTEDATVLYPMRGVSDLARMTPAAVEAKYGVPPARYPELAAIVGETSDNLPGVPGVGAGFAAKWINQFDGLDNVIAHAEEITGKKGEALREHLDDVIRNRRLNALVCDLPLEVEPHDLGLTEWDRQAALELLDELEFRGELRTRIMDTLAPAEEPVAEAGFDLSGRTVAPGELAAYLAGLGNDPVGLHVRGSWGSGTGRVDGLAFAEADGQAAYVDVATLTPEDDAALADVARPTPERPKIVHDANGPLLAVRAHGWQLAGLATDTAMMAYLVAPDQRSYALADLTLRHLKRELRQESGDDQGLLFETGDEVAETAMLHARAVIDLAEALRGRARRPRRHPPAQGHRAAAGRRCSSPWRPPASPSTRTCSSTLEEEFATAVREAAADAYEVIGKEINLGSPKQLQVVLFDELDMPKTKRTKTG